jgi:predicted enzyme related to lactoylglutathione lyase
MSTSIGSLIMVNLDSTDPAATAEFYGKVLGWEVTASADEYAMISDGKSTIGFGKIEGYEPPQWPDEHGQKRYHIDLYVDDLDDAEKACVALGATVPDFQPGETWRVLLDPNGQPFDVCLRS